MSLVGGVCREPHPNCLRYALSPKSQLRGWRVESMRVLYQSPVFHVYGQTRHPETRATWPRLLSVLVAFLGRRLPGRGALLRNRSCNSSFLTVAMTGTTGAAVPTKEPSAHQHSIMGQHVQQCQALTRLVWPAGRSPQSVRLLQEAAVRAGRAGRRARSRQPTRRRSIGASFPPRPDPWHCYRHLSLPRRPWHPAPRASPTCQVRWKRVGASTPAPATGALST
mmetsp:Transcript_91968/g.268981  ORF Transcript_91968/g.268981 Transcript_91968/m.268981 type:complete len:223 (-) Transcript_91968:545-1213(-)